MPEVKVILALKVRTSPERLSGHTFEARSGHRFKMETKGVRLFPACYPETQSLLIPWNNIVSVREELSPASGSKKRAGGPTGRSGAKG